MVELTPQQEMAFQERMQDRQNIGDPNAVYADSMREEKIKNVIAQLNPELLLVDIEHRIRGEKKDPVTGVWSPIGPEGRKVNELLVQNYISFLNVYLTQNNSLSNYTAQEINNIMGTVIDYIRDDLSDNAEVYGLTKKDKIIVEVAAKLLEPVEINGIKSMREIPITISQEVTVGEESTDYNEFNRIGHIVCQSTFSVLKQAQNGMLASRIFKALRISETNNEGGKKSAADFLKFW